MKLKLKGTVEFFAVTFLLVLASCATGPYRPYAREAKKRPGVDGIIALKENFVPEDRTYAETIMAKNCGETKAEVQEEGEVVVGTTTKSSSDSRTNEYNKNAMAINKGGFFSIGPSSTDHAEVTSQTSAQKEWQINYKCIRQMAKAEDEKPVKKVKVGKAKSTSKSNDENKEAAENSNL